MAGVAEIILLDADTNSTYKLILSPDEARRAREDMEFATKLLTHAKLVQAAKSMTESKAKHHQQQQQQQQQPQQQQQQQQLQLQQELQQQPQQQQRQQQEQQQLMDVENRDDAQHIWSNAETLLLLSLYKEEEKNFNSGKVTQKSCWAKISKMMQERGKIISGHKCTTKFQALKRTYKNVKAHNGKSGNERKDWEYFDILDEMFQDKPWMKPLAVAGSNIKLPDEAPSTSQNQSVIRKARVDTALLQFIQDAAENRRERRESQEARNTHFFIVKK